MTICKDFAGVGPDILVLQETKIEVMSDLIVADVWGSYSNDWLALPSWGASGGILLIWNANKVEILDHELWAFSILM